MTRERRLAIESFDCTRTEALDYEQRDDENGRMRKGEMRVCVMCVYRWNFAVCFCLDFRAISLPPIEAYAHIMSVNGEAREDYLFIYLFLLICFTWSHFKVRSPSIMHS